MKLIVGLGNPGEEYRQTRHNIGFMVAEALGKKLLPIEETNWQVSKKFEAEILTVKKDLVLMKPMTMMNDSGRAVKKFKDFYKLLPEEILVVHDDLDLALGKIKIVNGRGSAGHHGVDSIIESLGNADFWRLRIGVGHPTKKGEWQVGASRMVDFVTSNFDAKEKTEAKKMVKMAVEVAQVILTSGPMAAINRFHQ